MISFKSPSVSCSGEDQQLHSVCEEYVQEGERLSCHRFRANEVRLQLSVLAYNLGNLWRRLVLPPRIKRWSLTSLQQRLVKTGCTAPGSLDTHLCYAAWHSSYSSRASIGV